MAELEKIQVHGWLQDVNENFEKLGSLAGLHITKFVFDVDEDDAASTPVSNKTVAAHPMAVKIPANAIVISGFLDVIDAVTSGGSATVAVGLSTNALIAATGKATLLENAQLPMAAVIAAPFKLAAETAITVTVGTSALTAGVIEGRIIWMEGSE